MTPNNSNPSPWGDSKPEPARAQPAPAPPTPPVPQPIAPASGQPVRRKPHPWVSLFSSLFSVIMLIVYGLSWWGTHERNVGINHYNAGLAARKKGDTKTAIAEFSQAGDSVMEDSDRADAFFQRGYIFLQSNQNDKALADFSKTIELNNSYEQAYFSRSLIEIDKGQLAQASGDLDRVVQLKPDDTNVAAERTRIRELQGHQAKP